MVTMQHLQPNTTLQGGKYRIERVLGQGGFGNTYVGYNTEFEETVAIKEFFMKGVTERDETTSFVSVSNADNVQQFEEQREKFKKEARRLRKLKNEHIVKVHDLFEENGTAYYVMDYIEGESLAERLKRIGRPIHEQEINKLLPQILEALREVHKNEMWHLDLKPGNIMVDKQGNAYLIDFGASKQIRANGSMTTSTALCYTPGYAPNEQIGQMYDRFGPWTDIYALGATIYNLLTNKKPPMAIDIEEDEEDAFDFPTSISEAMHKLVVWMMQPKRKARPQNVDEILNKIKIQNQSKCLHKTSSIISPNSSNAELKSIPSVGKPPSYSSAPSINDKNEETIYSSSDKVANNGVNSYKDINVSQKVLSYKDEKRVILNLSSNIRSGNFVYYDGTYSSNLIKNEQLLGIVFTENDGNRSLVSTTNFPKQLIINGKSLKWRIATLSDWKRLVVSLWSKNIFAFPNGSYVFSPVENQMNDYQLFEKEYETQEDENGFTYIVNMTDGIMHIKNEAVNLPFLYIIDY